MLWGLRGIIAVGVDLICGSPFKAKLMASHEDYVVVIKVMERTIKILGNGCLLWTGPRESKRRPAWDILWLYRKILSC